MANGLEGLGEVRDDGYPIVLADGKTYQLMFDFNALCDLAPIEEELGIAEKAELDASGKLQFRFDFRHLRAKLWAGLRRYHGQQVPTLEDAGRLIPVDEFPRIARQVDIAFEQALLGKKGAPQAGGEQEEAAQTGPSSTTGP